MRSTVRIFILSARSNRRSPQRVSSSTALTAENMSEIKHIALMVCLCSSSLILGLKNVLEASISWCYGMCITYIVVTIKNDEDKMMKSVRYVGNSMGNIIIKSLKQGLRMFSKPLLLLW